MSASRNINVLMTGNATQLKTTLAAAGNDVAAFNKKIETTGKGGSRMMQTLGVAAKAGGLLVAAGFAYSIKAAAEFETRMRNVNSISGLSEKQLGHLSDQVRNMSTSLPQSANDLAEGLYDIASSGFQGSAGLEVLQRSAEAASAGLSTTAVAAKGITAVLNAYGLEAEDAAHVSNVLFQGVNVGVMTFEELASTVGDFAGTAAAAGISIDDATAAMATMTLAGISAAESGTSLNRLMQTMIQPGEQLAGVFNSWGYESGEAAINALGLKGVMDKLREATGGNVTQLLQLFPEIRAARGALALMSAEGKNYTKTSKAMADADKDQGATRKALKEQMKSLSAQFQLFVNWLNSTAIAIGTKALPALNDLVDVAKEVFSSIGDAVAGVAKSLGSFFSDLVDAAKDFGGAAKDVASNLAPIVKILAGIVGMGILATLKLLGSTLAFVADVAHRFSGVLAMLAIGFAVFRGYDMLNNVVNTLGQSLSGLVSKAGGVGKGLSGMAGAVGGAELAVSGFAIGVMVVAGVMQAISGEAAKAKVNVKEFTDSLDIDPSTVSSLAGAVHEYEQQIAKLNATADQSNLSNLGQLLNPFESNTIQQARDQRKLLGEASEKTARQESNLRANTELVADSMGVSRKEAENYAKKLGVDLTKDIARSGPARKEILDHFKKTRAEAGVTKDAVKSFSQESMDALEEAMKQEKEFLDGVEKSVTATQDVWAKFGKDGASGQALTDFYTDQYKTVTDFTANIAKAQQMGLNPEAVAQALTAGPAGAGKLLEQIVGDSSGKMVELVNNGAAALQSANTKLLEMARIAHKATTAESSQMVADAGNATKISLAALESSAFSSAETLAAKLGMPIEEVKRIAGEYGIVIDQANGKPLDPKVNETAVEQVKATLGDIGKLITATMTEDPEFKIAMDIEDPVQKTAELNRIALKYVNSNPTTKAYFDSLDAEGQMVYISGLLKSLPGTEGGQPLVMRFKALANIQPATESIGDLQGRIEAYAASSPTASAYLNTHNPTENAAYLKLLAAAWGMESPEAKALLDKLGPQLDFATLKAWAETWGKTHKTATADVKTNTSEAQAQLDAFVRQVRTISIQAIVTGQAARPGQARTDNRHGRIHSFRYGGTSTQAHVQHGEAIRYAEHATGGEAFIPRKGAPGRSRRILEQAAKWYGLDVVKSGQAMRAGGVGWSAPASQMSGVAGGGSMVNVVVHINAPVYGVDQLDKAITDGATKAFGKNYDKVVTTLRTKEDSRK